jgi:hypothetical protein
MSQTTLNGLRTLLVVVAALLGWVHSVAAQQSEPSSASVDHIRTALQSPQHPFTSDGVPLLAPSEPDVFRVGVLTFLPPTTPGQFVSIGVPIGALASRAAHSIAVAQHRRAQNAARDEVAGALAEFNKSQRK